MTVTALVMAGGRGTRMKLPGEKPLIQVCGKPVIEYVLRALKNSQKIDATVVAVSDNTPETAQYLEELDVQVLKTPGIEYVSDMGYAVRALRLETVLTIGADMPLVTSEVLDDIIERYFACGKAALAVTVPAETKQRLGMSLGYAFDWQGRRVVPVGINVNDGLKIDEPVLEQIVYVLDKVEVAVNINTVEELKQAEQQVARRLKTD